ncbi:MAG: helix-turn-helix domain-containing protein [Pirellulales bacterium]
MPDYLTPKAVAQTLDVSLSCVYSLCAAGEIEAIRVGLGRNRAPYRIAREALDAYIERCRSAARDAANRYRDEHPTDPAPSSPALPRARLGRAEPFRLLRAGGWTG